MPCTDGGIPHPEPSPSRAFFQAALCALLTILEDPDMNYAWVEVHRDPITLIDCVEAGIDEDELREWWREHKAEDAERRRREELEERERLRKASKDRAKEGKITKLMNKLRGILSKEELKLLRGE